MSFFDAFIGGAADAGAGILANQIKSDSELERQKAVAEFNSQLEIQKTKVLEQFRQEQRDAPLNRIRDKEQEFSGQDIPLEAQPVPPVTQTGGILNRGAMTGNDGQPIQGQGDGDVGLVGNVDTLKTRMQDPKDSMYIADPTERAGALSQLQKQVDQQTQANQALANAANAGKTRKRTADESRDAALDWAKVNDLPAYAAYQRDIGRPEREQQRLEQNDTNQNRRLDIQQSFNEARSKIQDRLADIAEARANRLEGRQDDQATKAEMQNTRNALQSVLKDIGSQEDKLSVKMLDPTISPEQKAVLDKQLKSLDAERQRARTELLHLAGVEPQPISDTKPVPSQAALDYLAKNPDTKDKFIAMYGADALPKQSTAAPTPAKPEKPGYTAPPTMEEVQAFYREKTKQMKIAQDKMANDPRIADLKAKQADALRRSKPIEANGYLQQIKDIEKSYGL